MSDQETQDEATEAQETAWKAKETRWSVEKAILTTPGVNPAQVDDIAAMVQARMVRDEIEVDEALARVRETTPALFSKPHPGGGGGRSVAPAERLTPERVREIYATGQQEKYREQLKDYHARRMASTTGPRFHRPTWTK